jgi:hypothetical protein
MTWYYAVGNERQGPVDDAALDRLIATGVVTPETLVWKAGMADWQPLAQARPRTAPVPAPVVPPPPAAIVPTPTPTPTPTDPAAQPRFGTPATPSPAPTPGAGSYGAPGSGYGAGGAYGAAGSAGGWNQAGGAGPETADQIYARVITSGRRLAIGELVGRAWQLVSANMGLAIGATVVVMICLVIAGVIPCVGFIIGLVVNPVLIGGLYRLFLKMHRNEPAEFGDAFSTFSTSFLQLFLFGLVQIVLSFVALIPGYALIFAGSLFADRNEALTLMISLLGVLLILPPMIYLGVSWIFASLLIVDKGLDFWPAMELSRRVTGKHFFSVFGVLFLGGLVMIAGVLALCVGLLVTAPIFFAMITIAYDDLFGRA